MFEKMKKLWGSSRVKVALATILCAAALEFFGIKISLEVAVLIVGGVFAFVYGQTTRPAGGAKFVEDLVRKMLGDPDTDQAPPDNKPGDESPKE